MSARFFIDLPLHRPRNCTNATQLPATVPTGKFHPPRKT